MEDAHGGVGGPEGRGRIMGVVPCAGQSRRMGRPKALLDAGGAPFLARVITTLRHGGCAPVMVVLRPEPASRREAELALDLGARVVRNPDPTDGPISSIRTALLLTPPEIRGVAVLPVDHPGVDADTVALLVDAFLEHHAQVVVPRYGDRRGHPALFREDLFPRLLDPALEGGARTVVRALGDQVLELPVDDPAVVQDIDDPAAYRQVFPSAGR